jgi:hypothetical protein
MPALTTALFARTMGRKRRVLVRAAREAPLVASTFYILGVA